MVNISYFSQCRTNTLETLVYKLNQEFFEEGQIIFKNGDKVEKVYILADGSVDTYLSLHDEDLILDNLKISGSILGQYTSIMQQNINYSARATSETNMLVVSVETINKVRADNPELNMKIKGIIQGLQEKGMPLCDYVCMRKKAKINAILDQSEFNGRQVFLDMYEKWRKVFKHSRKKEFKFNNLLKFIQNNQVSEAE